MESTRRRPIPGMEKMFSVITEPERQSADLKAKDRNDLDQGVTWNAWRNITIGLLLSFGAGSTDIILS